MMSKMKNNSFISRFRVLNAAAALVVMMTVEALAATTPLSDQPILVANVPANVMLALSVEFPTAITRAHQGDTCRQVDGAQEPALSVIFASSRPVREDNCAKIRHSSTRTYL